MPYGYGAPVGEMMAFGGLLVLAVILVLFACSFSIVGYVLQSVGMYSIAKRRGIRRGWLAWLPLGNMWILGSISDQYQYVAKGKVKNRRKVLLWLTVAIWALSIPSSISTFGMMMSGLAEDPSATGFAVSAIFGALFGLATAVVSVIALVYQYMAVYDLYASADPGNAVLYLVLSIFIAVTMPVFIYICRKKDLGMPPRKIVPPPAPAAPAAPVAPAAPADEDAADDSNPEATPEEDA